MQITVSRSTFNDTKNDKKTDTLVLFVSQRANQKPNKKTTGEEPAKTKAQPAFSGLTANLENFLQTQEVITGATKQAVFYRSIAFTQAKNLLVVGLGETSKVTLESVRLATAKALQTLKAEKITAATLLIDTLAFVDSKIDKVARAATEGLALADYSFDECKSKPTDKPSVQVTLASHSKARYAAIAKGVALGQTLAECTNFTRRLGDLPGNKLTPQILADETVKAAKGSGLKVTVWNKAQIQKEKMGSFLSVSQGSLHEPRMIIMEYRGAAASKKPICFVGKGLTFDSGGISIKPSASMEEMKYDMCGGGAVIGALLAIARLKLKVNAIGVVPATENMPGHDPNKPGDIITARNGKTIEVNNTDAEGRLILADALVWASEQKPACIIDTATLTGAIIVALSNIHTGVFTRHDKLFSKLQEAADRANELIWRMPLLDFHADDVKGTYGDLSNIGKSKGAGSATAAAFLEHFVDSEIPWAHCDIAGTAWNCGDRAGYHPQKGATGALVRTFVELAQSY